MVWTSVAIVAVVGSHAVPAEVDSETAVREDGIRTNGIGGTEIGDKHSRAAVESDLVTGAILRTADRVVQSFRNRNSVTGIWHWSISGSVESDKVSVNDVSVQPD